MSESTREIIEPPGLLLRRPLPSDLEPAAHLHWRSWQATYARLLSPEELAHLTLHERQSHWQRLLGDFADRRSCWLAELNGQIVGLVHWAEIPRPQAGAGPADRMTAAIPTAEIHAIHVAPEMQGGGIGRSLLEAAVREMREAAFRRAILWVLAANGRARRFYEAAGWRWDGTATVRPMGDLAGLPLVEEVRYWLEIV